MMYEELIKRLREAPSDWPDAELHYEAADAIEDLITALTASNEVIAKNKPKWIPVTERLPNSLGHYLVFIIGGEYRQISWATISYFDGKIFRWEHLGQEHSEDVTHWMPLPQPPKADKDGGV